jgi:hypothetical protein
MFFHNWSVAMFRKNPSLRYRSEPAVLTRFATVPLVRERSRLVGVRLETDQHRVNPNRVYVGVEHLKRVSLPNGERVEVWADVQWLDTSCYRNLLTEQEAREWVATGFSQAANDEW